MPDHKEHEAAFNKAMESRGDNHKIEYNSGEDRAVTPGVPDRTRFSQNDGDDGDLRLAAKVKNPTDNSRMPTITDNYQPNGKGRIA
jgi:hypothetical protein